MLFGGMFIQILIQAAILRLSLKIIAKHEADTTYSKALMVTAGISIGQLIVAALVAHAMPLAVLPAIVAFTAAVIMYFCWISFWKSVLVVLIYMALQLVFTIGAALVMGISAAAMLGFSGGDNSMPSPPPHYQQAVEAQGEAQRMQQEAMRKQAQIEAEVQRMEQESYQQQPPTPAPAPATVKPKPEQPEPPKEPVPAKVEPSGQSVPASSDIDWEGARKALRVGGIMSGGKDFLALINGKMVNQGNIVKAQHNGREYRWRVKAVTSKEVDLEQLDAR